MNRLWKYSGQNIGEQPSVYVTMTTSTGKTATVISAFTIQPALNLPTDKLKDFKNKSYLSKLGHSTHVTLQHKYHYMKVLLIDEISMLNERNMRDIDILKENMPEFGGVYIIDINDLFLTVIPPVAFELPKGAGMYYCVVGNKWHNLKVYELKKSIDPEFPELLNRLREGDETYEDIEQIRALEDSDTTNWSEQYVKLYITYHEAGTENEQHLVILNPEMYTINTKDSKKDWNTRNLEVTTINADVSLSKTRNLPKQLKVSLDARVMITTNIDTAEKLIYESCGQIKRIRVMYLNPLDQSTIYLKCNDPNPGNSKKRGNLPGELKEWRPIRSTLRAKRFHGMSSQMLLLQESNFVWYLVMQWQFINHSGLDLIMLCDLNRATHTGKKKTVPVVKG